MTRLANDVLLENLAEYGYPLLMPKSHLPEEVMTSLLDQDDMRLLEGFPVVFFNALQEKDVLEWELNPRSFESFSPKALARLSYLLAFSLLLFTRYAVEEKHVSRAVRLLEKLPQGTELRRQALEEWEKSAPVKAAGMEFSYERLKNAFETYVVQSPKREAVEHKKQVYEFELLLSQLFTPKQKVLLKKKQQGQPLTKTEREYFSRVVKKRLKALASDEVHQMAKQLAFK